MPKKISYSRQSLGAREKRAVEKVLASDFLTTGPAVEAFEKAVADQAGVEHAVAVSNGTVALHLACLALGFSPGYKGVTSPLSFAASANAILYTGGKVDFIDIGAGNGNMSVKNLEGYCRRRQPPDLVIPVSYAGIPADLPGIRRLAEKYRFRILEDAAHSIGSRYRHEGKWYHSGGCAHSDLAIFSFHPVKNITTAEGGMITTNDSILARRCRELRHHGVVKGAEHFRDKKEGFTGKAQNPWYYEVQELGYNARLSDVHAAIGVEQIKRLKGFKKKKQALVERYNRAFEKMSSNLLPFVEGDVENHDNCYHLYPLRVKNKSKRFKLFKHLQAEGILPQVHYIPIHLQPLYQDKGFGRGQFKQAEDFYDREISLPLYPGLSPADQDRVIRAVRKFFK